MRFNANILAAEKNKAPITGSSTAAVNSWTDIEETSDHFAHAVSIQRAWRSYRNSRHSIDKLDKDEPPSEPDNSVQMMSLSTPDDCVQNQRSDNYLLTNDRLDCEISEVDQAEELKFAERKGCGLPSSLAVRCGIESEPESIVSDYSEMADPIKEHLANVQIIQKEDLDLGNAFVNNFLVQPKIFRGVEEDEEEFNKRVRKTNYLSLAQEFAELKKVNANALPFGLHKDEYQSASPLSEGESGSDLDSADQCNDNSSGFKLSNGDCSVIDSGQARDEGLTTEKTEVKSGSSEAVNLTDEKKQEDAGIDEKELHDPDYDLASNSNLQRGLLMCEALSKKVEMKSKEAGDNPHSKKNQALTAASDVDSLMAAGHESDSSSFTDSPVRVKVTRRKMDESLGESLGEFDIYTVETALPQMDWQHLEEQLQKAAEEEQQKWSHCGDREQIRRKLAMPIEDDAFDSELLLRKPSLQTRLQTNMNLHVCYVNEAAEAPGSTHNAIIPATTCISGSTSDAFSNQTHSLGVSVSAIVDPYENGDFFTKQARLQAEAKMALAQVRPMAHMQLQLEKQLKKKSPLAEIVGIPGFINGKLRHLSNHLLRQMNFAQIQLVVNDLHAQIEVLNLELMQQLVERDDLHMAQDSMLVDIEDLTGRAQEFAARVNKRTERKESFTK